MTQDWQTVIGLEVHVQLKTASKLFSAASTAFGAAPNQHACTLSLGLPGELPVLNQQAVLMAVRFGLSVNAEVARKSVFSRKNYFYPDLPKGYQISQDAYPIVRGGQLPLPDGRVIDLERAHLEEDAGKSVHLASCSGMDFNRAGVPLLEIVSKPQMHSAQEAVAYLKALHALVVCLDLSTGNMQEGAFRCDANVSVRPSPEAPLGQRVELKNINSFRFVEKAIDYEVERQIKLLSAGGRVIQETRLYDEVSHTTRSMRRKEDAGDYRYFPDPDIPPLVLNDDWIEDVQKALPELPWMKRERFENDYQLSAYDATVLTSDMGVADWFERALSYVPEQPKIMANWVSGECLAALKRHEQRIEDMPISHQQLADLVRCVAEKTISTTAAKKVFEVLWSDGGQVHAIIDELGLRQVNDAGQLQAWVDAVVEEHPEQLADYRSGKDKLFGFFVGQIMKRSRGQANPSEVTKLLQQALDAKRS